MTEEPAPVVAREQEASVPETDAGQEPAGSDGTPAPRRRRSRGGRGRRRRPSGAGQNGSGPDTSDTADTASSSLAAGASEATADQPTGARRRRRRGGRGRGRSRPTGDGAPADGEDSEEPAAEDAAELSSAGPEEAGAPAGEEAGAAAARKPRSRSRRKPASKADAAAASQDAKASESDAAAPADADQEEGAPTPAARPRTRRPRKAPLKTGEAEAAEGDLGAPAPAVAAASDADESLDAEKATGAAASRRRTSRSRRGRAAAGEATGPEPAPADEAPPDTRPAGRGKKAAPQREPAERPRRRGRSAEGDESRPTRTRAARATTRRRREPAPVVRRAQDKVMLITEIEDRDQIAVMEDRELVEHYITRAGTHSMVGNIYLGRVQNVLPGMEAAFIDVGRGRNAVLYAGEVNYDDQDLEAGDRRIERALKAGQSVLVQVTKDPIGGKGARLTAQISLPGRYLVLVPHSQVFGISRRLPDEERKRLRAIVKKVRPEEHGIICRTAADGASEEDMAADVARLVTEWKAIEKSAKKGKPPRLIYEEPELTVRVVRDLFTGGEFKEIVTDSQRVHARITEYLREVAPELVDMVRLHSGPLPLFEDFHATEQIHKALDRKVWLPSGGYVIIERVEAMTVIDVNTGKHVGKTNLEETVVKTNLEAAEETARQLRLRDIGGIIIIDFIDMLLEKNKDKVVNALKDAMAQDKTRSQVFEITPLGLLEVTRKRVSAGLLESFSETCPTCEGRGILLTHDL